MTLEERLQRALGMQLFQIMVFETELEKQKAELEQLREQATKSNGHDKMPKNVPRA